MRTSRYRWLILAQLGLIASSSACGRVLSAGAGASFLVSSYERAIVKSLTTVQFGAPVGDLGLTPSSVVVATANDGVSRIDFDAP